MSASVFSIILFAAALHAIWNAIVKGSADMLLTAILVVASAGAIAIVALPFLPQPAPASWPFLAVSTVLQTAYYFLIVGAYRLADMSQAYPLMRGTAPLLVAVASAFWLGEAPSPAAWLGIALISSGVIAMAMGARDSSPLGIAFAVLNAVVIASYTICDGLGVRHSGSPAAYTLWLSLLTAVPLVTWALSTRAAAFGRQVRSNLRLGIIGGAGTLGSYGLALWAMTLAPVAVVAALRETSILFATAIATFVLKERVSAARLAAIGLIAAGVVVLRLG